jgi:hypothetical protein
MHDIIRNLHRWSVLSNPFPSVDTDHKIRHVVGVLLPPLPPRRTLSAIPRDKSDITIALLSHIKQNDTKMFQKKPLIIRNMRVLSVIALGVLALGVVTFKSVTSLPKLKAAAAAPFDWQQYLPAGKSFTFSVSFLYCL